jgi:hypothetical protein
MCGITKIPYLYKYYNDILTYFNEKEHMNSNIFLQNKYTKWYFNIITRRQTQHIRGYVEKHHIIPRSIGGTDEQSNLVCLTAREHFICHLLLIKMTIDIANRKMTQAAKALILLRNEYRERIKVGSRTYECLKHKFSLSHSEMMKTLWETEEYKSRLSMIHKTRCQTTEFKKQQSTFFINKWSESDYRNKMSVAIKQVWVTGDRKEKHIAYMKQKWSEQEYRDNQIKKSVEGWKDPIRRTKTIAAQKLAMTEERKTAHSDKVKLAHKNGSYDDCCKNRTWITNGKTDKFIYRDQLQSYLENGFKIGRRLKTRVKGTWYTNGIENKFALPDQVEFLVSQGFYKGMKPRKIT